MPRRLYRGLILNQRLLGRDKVEFIHHALVRMNQRGVSQAEVFHTIEHPSQTGLPTQPGRQRVRWNKSINYSVDVVFELMDDRVRIITVMRVADHLRGIAPKIYRIGKEFPKTRKHGRRR
jgi:hypothetical protein